MAKTKRFFRVSLQLNAFDVRVYATTEAEAKRKAFDQTMKRGYRAVVDFNNTSANKED
jgi:hypothetical protein